MDPATRKDHVNVPNNREKLSLNNPVEKRERDQFVEDA